MLCVILVSERQKKKLFFLLGVSLACFRRFIGIMWNIVYFWGTHLVKVRNHKNVLSLFSVVVIPNSSPTIPLCNHTVYLNIFSSINWLKSHDWCVCLLLPLYRSDNLPFCEILPFSYHQRATKPLICTSSWISDALKTIRTLSASKNNELFSNKTSLVFFLDAIVSNSQLKQNIKLASHMVHCSSTVRGGGQEVSMTGGDSESLKSFVSDGSDNMLRQTVPYMDSSVEKASVPLACSGAWETESRSGVAVLRGVVCHLM